MKRLPRAPGRPTCSPLILVVAAAILIPFAGGARVSRAADPPADSPPPAADTAGAALLEWAYDSWTVPWVQVRGASRMLAPTSNATLMVLACETSNLERDRLARHLSAEECEHRVAAIRADQDTALIFRADLRVFEFPGSVGLLGLDPAVRFSLEDDRGRRWGVVNVQRGPVLGTATGFKLRRTYQYHPPWMRGAEHLYPSPYELSGGRNLTLVEHRLRFPRRDPLTLEPLVTDRTRWLRLRLASGDYEWVATWTFRPEGGGRP